MIDATTLLTALSVITLINFVRHITALRSLIFIMREAHPLLYQKVDGHGFFRSQGNMTKQVRLFHYLKEKEYQNHHEDVFIQKCTKVRETFVLTVGLAFVTVFLACTI